MKCPKCNSENVQMQAKEAKLKLAVPCMLMLGGFGSMFLGIFGLLIGAIIGGIIAAIVDSILPTGYQSIMVCQDCGYVSAPLNHTQFGTSQHPLFCQPNESNLDIVRNDVAKGTIVVVRIKIDDYAPFDMGDNLTTYLKLTEGEHVLSYEQINGIGRKKNRGQFNVQVGEKRTVEISFTRQGLIVK